MTTPAPQRVLVGSRAQLGPGDWRQLVRCGTRNVAVVQHGGRVYAVDNACYHHGGPLLKGDIEDMGGHPCIVCPWHGYRIALDTGECLYVGLDMAAGGGRPREVVRSKGCKQRVHRVVEEGGKLYVEVDLTGDAWESDYYAELPLANQERASGTVVHGGGAGGFSDYRSGHVFQNKVSLTQGLGNPLALHSSGRRRVSLGIGGGDGGSTGTGGANNASAATDSVPGSPTGGGGLSFSCVRSEPVCTDVRQFFFSTAAGRMERQVALGEYVEFVLPVKDAEGRPLRRKWTVADASDAASLFSIVVKANRANPGGGSVWLHDKGLHVPLPVAAVGGSFTFADHAEALRRVGGRAVWLTAGSGVVAAYAALNSTLNDSFYVQNAAEELHVLHLHTDRTPDRVAKLPELVEWARRFPDTGARGQHKTYVLELLLTGSQSDAERGLHKQKRARAAMEAAAEAARYATRLTPSVAADVIEQHLGVQRDFLAYLCGPPSFIESMTAALLSMGVSEANILTDDY